MWLLVSVNVNTGELKWPEIRRPVGLRQRATETLADLQSCRTRKVIMQANKNGFFYVLDRITGEFIRQPFSRVAGRRGSIRRRDGPSSIRK